LYVVGCVLALAIVATAQPSSGWATVTAYGAAQTGGACNCAAAVENYPTAAMSQNYFGAASGQGAGPACGKCYHLHLYGDPYDSTWCSDSYDIVVKVADLCPYAYPNYGWCPANPGDTNQFGAPIHFDMAENTGWVQQILAASGRGAFIAKYCQVDCSNWAGWGNGGTQSSDWGYCPVENTNGYTEQCDIPAQCSSGGGTTTGASGGGGIVWASGVNAWWVAFAVEASTVYLDCGNGWVLLPYGGFTINGVPVWAWQGHPYPCSTTVNIDYDGTVLYNVQW